MTPRVVALAADEEWEAVELPTEVLGFSRTGSWAIYPAVRSAVTRPLALLPHGSDSDPLFRESIRAKAKAMAAAPLLLRALEALVEDYEQLIGAGFELDPPQPLKDALAAILAAKGDR